MDQCILPGWRILVSSYLIFIALKYLYCNCELVSYRNVSSAKSGGRELLAVVCSALMAAALHPSMLAVPRQLE